MTVSPLVSVIIPTHNRAHWLPLAIQSALYQTHEAMEVIVVDDGSTDVTPEVVRAFGDRITYIRQDNAGVSRARNRGFAASRGDFVCFLDDDDIYLPGKISAQLDALHKRRTAPLANCRYFIMSEGGALLHHTGLPPERDSLEQLLLSNFVWMSGPLIRRGVFEQCGGFDERLSIAADLDIWLRITQLGDLITVQQPLGAYRIHTSSMLADVANTEEECLRVLQWAFARSRWSPAQARLRHRSESLWRMWFGSRYLALGNIAGFQRNFANAFACAPWMFDDSKWLIRRLGDAAMDYRVPDALAFVHTMFTHLPASLRWMRGLHDDIDCTVRANVAFRKFGTGDVQAGQAILMELVATYPNLPRDVRLFERALFHAAMTAVTSPQSFIDTVMKYLPRGNAALAEACVRARHDAALWSGFEAFIDGQYARALGMLLPALQNRPHWLINRGIASALTQSWIHSRDEMGASRREV